MSTVKDWIKVLIAALTGTLVTLVLTSVFAYPGNIKKEIKKVEQKANLYTDTELKKHEEKEEYRFKSIDLQQKNLKEKTNDTYEMVKFLYERELNRQ